VNGGFFFEWCELKDIKNSILRMFVTEQTKESRKFRFSESTAGDIINYADEG
jgi:hypothetical protein